MDTVVEKSAAHGSPHRSTCVSRCRRRAYFVPSFFAACCTLLLVAVTHVIWLFADVQYDTMLYTVRVHVGLEGTEHWLMDAMWDETHLGHARLMCFTLLTVVGVASTLLLVVQFVRRTTISRMLAIVFVICIWLSLWTSYGELHHWALVRHASGALSRFQIVAHLLSRQWPTQNGRLPEAGSFYAYPKSHPNLLLLHERRGYPTREDFFSEIERSGKGAIRFDLSGATGCQVEYHPNGSSPATYTSSLGSRMVLRDAVSLSEDGWYFVRYR